jgi:hypothetical protein
MFSDDQIYGGFGMTFLAGITIEPRSVERTAMRDKVEKR